MGCVSPSLIGHQMSFTQPLMDTCTSGVVLQPAGQVAAPGEDEDDRLLRPDLRQIESAGLRRKVARSPPYNFRADAEDGLSDEENESRKLEIWQIQTMFYNYNVPQFSRVLY